MQNASAVRHRRPVIYTAAAALAHDDRDCAIDALRGQLTIMALAAEASPDWTTLRVTGPTEMAGAEARIRFEWTASVAVPGATFFDVQPDPDVALPPIGGPDDTICFGCHVLPR
jgi:hypothetical protein